MLWNLNAKAAAMFMLAISAVIYFAAVSMQIERLKSTIVQRDATITQYAAANNQCAAQIDIANRSLDEIKAASDRRAIEAENAIAMASKKASESDNRARLILGAKKTGSDCEASKRLLDGYFKK